MTSEGYFPKIDGDILYASEVNRFAKASIFIGAGSTLIAGSHSVLWSVGSIVISANTFSGGYASLHIINDDMQAITNGSYAILISGIGGNGICKTRATSNALFLSTDVLMISASDGGFINTLQRQHAGEDNGAVTASYAALNNLNPTGIIVVDFQTIADTAGQGQLSYMIQGFRGIAG